MIKEAFSMELDYKKLALAKKDDILKDLGELIAIDSSEDLNNASEEYPVGPGPVKAMKKFLSFAERDGFDVQNFNNYAGRVNYGEGQKRLWPHGRGSCWGRLGN